MTSLPSSPARRPPHWPLLSWACLAAGALAMAGLLAAGRPLPAALVASSVVATVLAWRWLRLPAPLHALIGLAAVVNAMSISWDWYTAWAPFDEWAHLLNPVILVAPSMVWFHRARIVAARPAALFVAAAAAYGLALAAAWEVIETWFWTYPLSDTLSDVALGLGGSAAGGWLAGRIIAARP